MTERQRGDSRITAVLGPTNTGKTYLAIERMLAHDSGMVGFPLRLLARENYDRVARIKGRNRVALITGEEKILSESASYFPWISWPLTRSNSAATRNGAMSSPNAFFMRAEMKKPCFWGRIPSGP
jgi:hypothetical protein